MLLLQIRRTETAFVVQDTTLYSVISYLAAGAVWVRYTILYIFHITNIYIIIFICTVNTVKTCDNLCLNKEKVLPTFINYGKQ